jgi:hypothetical protein
MDKEALDLREHVAQALHDRLCEVCLQRVYPCDEMDDERDSPYHMGADSALYALGANGYVVVPRHLLDELLRATAGATIAPTTIRLDRVAAARAAVVEAVGANDDACLCPFAGEDDPCPCASGNHDGCPRCPSVDRSVSAVGPTREDQR